MANPNDVLKHTADTISGFAIVGALLDYLPTAAALAGVIWYLVQIWESKTVQKRVRVWKQRQRFKRLASLKHKVADVKEAITDDNSQPR